MYFLLKIAAFLLQLNRFPPIVESASNEDFGCLARPAGRFEISFDQSTLYSMNRYESPVSRETVCVGDCAEKQSHRERK